MTEKKGLTANLVFAIAAGAIGSAWQHGYNTGVVNAPQDVISKFINETYEERKGVGLSQTEVDFVYSIMVSIFCVGGMIGALTTGIIADRVGRRNGLLFNNVLAFIATACMYFSESAKSYELLIVGRFIIGLNAGLNAGLSPMYLSEISPVHLRGAIGTIYQLVITISILIAIVLGLPELLGDSWPTLFSVTIIPAILSVVALPLCVESPKYLLVIQGKDVNAQKALMWLRGTADVHDEMDEMKNEVESLKVVPKASLSDMFKNDLLRRPMIIAIVVMLSQQFSGINAVIFYSTQIFKNAGLSEKGALWSSVIMGVVNVGMTVVSLFLVDRSGRRTLHLFGLGGCALMTVLLTICLMLKDFVEFLSYVAVIAVYGFIIAFASGPGSIPWFLVSELFGIGARGLATSIAVGVNWSAAIAVGLFFLPIMNLLNDLVFVVFTILLSCFWIYTYKQVPETKGKTIDEIQESFKTQ